MQVLHLWRSDYLDAGGGAIAMNRLHSGLRRAGIDSEILCQRKSTDSLQVNLIPRAHRAERIIKAFTSRLGLNDIHRISSFKIKHHEAYARSDILHFHGTHSGFINYLALPSLTRDKPAVFTLHDMWPFTGNCVYSYDSDRWKTGCGNCDHPHVHPPIRRDATRVEWKLKAWVYSRSNFTIVSPSGWMAEQAKQSMLNHYPIHQIPYGVDTDVYQPLDSEQSRSVLKIPRGKKVLMFSAIDVDDWRKGGDLLIRTLQILPASLKTELVLLTLGNRGERLANEAGIEALAFGYVSSDRLKAILYSAADIFVLPTRADNLPLTIMESLGCGTPVVSFKVGGLPELVRPGITGYLAEPENEIELSKGILRLLEDEPLRTSMSQQCRLICLEKYNEELSTKRHAELYEQLLRNNTG